MTKQEIDCERALAQILEYVDRELDEADRAAMHRHLLTCKACFSRAEFERRLKEQIGALRGQEASARLRERIEGMIDGL